MQETHLIETQIESKSIFAGRVVNVSVDTVRLPSGDQATREVVRHPGAVAVAALNGNGWIVLVRQFRYPLGEVLWELPAGKIDPGEEPIVCAKRELREETGYDVEQIEHLTTLAMSPGFCDEKIHLFFAQGLRQLGGECDPDEVIDVAEVPLSEALEMVRKGEIIDSKSVATLLWLANFYPDLK